VRDKAAALAPDFAARIAPAAEAYQLRYLARRAFMSGDGRTAAAFVRRSLRMSRRPLTEEPLKTLSTWLASEALNLVGPAFHGLAARKLAAQTTP
jgi:hypothetical protein